MGPRGRVRMRSAPNTCRVHWQVPRGECVLYFYFFFLLASLRISSMWVSSYLFKSATPDRTLQRGENEESQEWRKEIMKDKCCICPPVREVHHCTTLPIHKMTAVDGMPNLLTRGLFLASENAALDLYAYLDKRPILGLFPDNYRNLAWKWANAEV